MKATNTKPSFINKLHYFWNFIPIKWNLIVLAAAGFLGYYFIITNYTEKNTSFSLYLELFAWILAVFCGVVISIGLLSSVFCWIYYLISRKRDKNKLLQIRIEEQLITKPGYVAVSFDLPQILIPFLGFVRARLIFKDKQQSDEILLRPQSWIHWFGVKKGEKRIFLPHRQTYDIESILVTFQDVFRLISWPILIGKKDTFHIAPQAQVDEPMEVPPSKSTEMTQRIRKLKKVEGDYLNYKDFESGDDIRRIVWKIYAKTKDLVIRVPETINPYASHVHLYCSYYQGLATPSDHHSRLLLDAYKDGVYKTFMALKAGDMKVSYHSDQPLEGTIQGDQVDPTLYSVINSRWQQEHSPVTMPIKNKDMIVCVSSLVSVDEVREMIEQHQLHFVYIKCSEMLESRSLIRFQELFLKSDISMKERWRMIRWKFSADRKRIIKNEQALEQLLQEQTASESD